MSRIYKSTVSTPLFVSYTCSKCGKANLYTHKIIETGQSFGSSYGTSHRKDYESFSAATDCTKKAASKQIECILKEQRNGYYRTAQLNCVCSNCGHRDPWAKLYQTSFEHQLKLITRLLVVAGIIFLLGQNYIQLYIALGVGVAIGIFRGVRFSQRNHLEYQITKLPCDSLPYIATDKEDMIQHLIAKSK